MPVKKTLSEQISDLQSKLQLLDGDRKAFYETAEYKKKKNRDTIAELRKRNKELRKKFAQSLNCDEDAINNAYEEGDPEKLAFRNKSTLEAVNILDFKKCDVAKKLNNIRCQNRTKLKKLEELQMKAGSKNESVDAQECEIQEDENAKTRRILENRQDKAQLKLQEASNMANTYEKILTQLKKERLMFSTQLGDIEEEIEKNKAELKELRVMQKDAEISKDAAKNELAQQEELTLKERKEREKELQELKKQAEDKKALQDKIERRAQGRSSMPIDQDANSEERQNKAEEAQKKIRTYDEAFQLIREATAVSEIHEIVERFRTQNSRCKNLYEHKESNEIALEQLNAQYKKLCEEYDDMKYTGESKLSSGQRDLEEFEGFLNKEIKRKQTAESEKIEYSNVLVNAKNGIEHLYAKIEHLKGTKSQEPKQVPQPSSPDYILDLLAECEDKLQKLHEDMKDVKSVSSLEFTQSPYVAKVYEKLPPYNQRIQIPELSKESGFDDDEDSGEDEDVQSRQQLKNQSQKIVESRMKRRPPKKKKGRRT